MRIFISFASEDWSIAEQVQLKLSGEGHEVFLDRDSLPPGESFDARIRAEIARSDLMVFLISPDSVRPGAYARTELKLARQRWPNPHGHVLPVVVRNTDFDDIPPYLKEVTVLRPEGNVAAEVLAALPTESPATKQPVEPRRTAVAAMIGAGAVGGLVGAIPVLRGGSDDMIGVGILLGLIIGGFWARVGVTAFSIVVALYLIVVALLFGI